MEGRDKGIILNPGKTLQIVFVSILVILCVTVLGFFIWTMTNNHPGPIFNIGNGFDQLVTVYFEGKKVGKIDPGKSKIFYPNEVLTKNNSDLLVELKSNSGTMLYSKNFTWDELSAVLESVHGMPYWIGDKN